MRSLQRVFTHVREQNPFWSDYICFAETVEGRKFTKQILAKHFNRLVDENDYPKSEKKRLIQHLLSLTQKGA